MAPNARWMRMARDHFAHDACAGGLWRCGGRDGFDGIGVLGSGIHIFFAASIETFSEVSQPGLTARRLRSPALRLRNGRPVSITAIERSGEQRKGGACRPNG